MGFLSAVLTSLCVFAIIDYGLCQVYVHCPNWMGILGNRQQVVDPSFQYGEREFLDFILVNSLSVDFSAL